jgi:NAD(P)-dependent dehydrogenase (short-subunit alcohol dehydrogenase family)
VVTGGSRAIGRAIARALAERGAAVAVNYRERAEAAAEAVAAIQEAGGKALAVQADVREADAVKALFKTVKAELGGLHILVNNAGVLRDSYLAFMSEAQWDEVVGRAGRGAGRAGRGLLAPGAGGGGQGAGRERAVDRDVRWRGMGRAAPGAAALRQC